jgi:transposase
LQARRGGAQTTAATMVSEVGTLSRMVASEHTSGGKVLRGPISKSGNVHRRRVPVESACWYHHRSNVKGLLLRRQTSLALSDEVKAMAWKAQHRLNKRYKTLTAKGENTNQIVTAIARELLGFAWAIATHTQQRKAAPAS